MRNLIKLLPGLFIALLLPLRCHGTIIVMEFGSDRIIIAADSHEISSGSSPGNDLACKITVLDSNSVFFAVGLESIRNPTTNDIVHFSDFAKTAFAESRPLADKYSLAKLTAIWGEHVRNILRLTFAPGQAPTDTVFLYGVFAALTSDHALGSYEIPFLAQKPIDSTYSQITFYNANLYDRSNQIARFGDEHVYAYIDEFLADETARSKLANSQFRRSFRTVMDLDYEPNRLRSAVQAAIDWMPQKGLIGGPVDVLVLDRVGGIRWVRKKDNCAK